MAAQNQTFAEWVTQQEANGVPVEDLRGPRPMLSAKARDEINRLTQDPTIIEPDRGSLDNPLTAWRYGKPNFTLANLSYLMGKSQCHAKGSLELLVENAVKTWEMEAQHKTNLCQWKTVVQDKYALQANGGRPHGLRECVTRGNYNVLLENVNPRLFNAIRFSFDNSDRMFREAFKANFPWEVLKVFTGPPEMVFSWRHWTEFVGTFEGHAGEGQQMEMDGYAAITVTEDSKITDLKVYFKPEKFLRELRGGEHSPKKMICRMLSPLTAWMESANIEHLKTNNPKFVAEAEDEIAKMSTKQLFLRPDRKLEDEPKKVWKSGPPSYTLPDIAFTKGRFHYHEAETFELIVENLMKTCEMEISHKMKRYWKTFAPDYKVQVNGVDLDNRELDKFVKKAGDFSPKAYPWELLTVFSKEPEIAFTWRHWYEIKAIGDGNPTRVPLQGFALLTLNEKREIRSMKLYYKPQEVPHEYLQGMGKCPFART